MKLTIEILECLGESFKKQFFFNSRIEKIEPRKEEEILTLRRGRRFDMRQAERIRRYAQLEDEICKTVKNFYASLESSANLEESSSKEA